MHIKALNLHGSPYMGVFCSVTDDIALVPSSINPKENKQIADTLGVETYALTIANSHLIGVLARGYGKKFAVANHITDHELESLHAQGIDVHVMREISAIGNLLCMQKNAGIISPNIHEVERDALEKFFRIPLHPLLVARSELAGSSVIATEKGFLANPRTAPHEMEHMESLFKVPGMTTTANYGDAFIGNSILANAHGVVVGERTSGPELSRIDEGLHPGLR
jgi:translation initiation factor 6